MALGDDGGHHKDKAAQVSHLLVRDVILDQVAHAHLQLILKFFVFLHFFLNQLDGLRAYVTPKVVETVEVPEEREKGVSDPAAVLVVVADNALVLVELFEESDFGHFPFEVGPVSEEVALVKLVELIPHLLSLLLGLGVDFFGELGLVFLELEDGVLLHLLGELIEDDLLLGPSVLVELNLRYMVLFIEFILRILLHCG